MALLSAAVLFFLAGLVPLLIGSAPSDPCPPNEPCGPEPEAFLAVGGGLHVVALVLAAAAGWVAWRRSRLTFVAPPEWPPAPAGWVPSPGWEPDPAWPAAPEGWVFWRRGRD
jgi:hypothetical protein